MLSARVLATADAFWAAHLGCPANELFTEGLRLVTHGADLADYDGVFALFRGGGATVSIPPAHADTLRPLLSSLPGDCTPDGFAAALRPVAAAVVGPAYTGYAMTIARPLHPARALGPDDAPALDALRRSCDAAEWEHGGSDGRQPCSAVFVGGQIAAVAGYKIWGGTLAHLAIITHPDFRGRGFGRSAVAHLARRAVAAGLLPQYRTLVANVASVRIAGSVGFRSYATSVAVRLGPEA